MAFWIWLGVLLIGIFSVPIAALLDKRGRPVVAPEPNLEESDGGASDDQPMMEEVAADQPADGENFDFNAGDAFAGFGNDDFKT